MIKWPIKQSTINSHEILDADGDVVGGSARVDWCAELVAAANLGQERGEQMVEEHAAGLDTSQRNAGPADSARTPKPAASVEYASGFEMGKESMQAELERLQSSLQIRTESNDWLKAELETLTRVARKQDAELTDLRGRPEPLTPLQEAVTFISRRILSNWPDADKQRWRLIEEALKQSKE